MVLSAYDYFSICCSTKLFILLPSGAGNNFHSTFRLKSQRFILFSGLLTGGFLLNEIYRIHIYMVAVGISQLGVSLLYAVILSSYGWFFRRELQRTPYPILLAGLGLLFFAIGVDSLNLKNKIFSSLLEGVPKLFSEINIAFYCYVCKCFLQKAFYKNIDNSL